MANKKPFYGWIVVAMLGILCAVPMVWLSSFFGYFQTPVCAELGCSYVEFNFLSTSSSLACVLFGAVLAGKVAAGKTRYWMLGGGLLAGLCMYLMGQAQSIWTMVILFGVANFAFSAVTYIPINVLIASWFGDKRATATSITLSGQGIGGMIFTPIAARLIADNWRGAYHITGIIVALIPLLVIWFLKKPEEMGLSPLMPKETTASADKPVAAASAWQGISKKEALKTKTFYMYALICICCGIVAAGVVVQLPTFFIENGIDYASRMTLWSLFSLIGLLVMGRVIDKLGIKIGTALTGSLLVISMLCLLMVPTSGGVFSYLAVVFQPLGCAISTLAPPLLASHTFGMKEYGGIYGLGQSFMMVGCLIGPLLASFIRTVSGSYTIAWIVFAAVAAFLIAGTFICIAGGKKLQKQPSNS